MEKKKGKIRKDWTAGFSGVVDSCSRVTTSLPWKEEVGLWMNITFHAAAPKCAQHGCIHIKGSVSLGGSRPSPPDRRTGQVLWRTPASPWRHARVCGSIHDCFIASALALRVSISGYSTWGSKTSRHPTLEGPFQPGGDCSRARPEWRHPRTSCRGRSSRMPAETTWTCSDPSSSSAKVLRLHPSWCRSTGNSFTATRWPNPGPVRSREGSRGRVCEGAFFLPCQSPVASLRPQIELTEAWEVLRFTDSEGLLVHSAGTTF